MRWLSSSSLSVVRTPPYRRRCGPVLHCHSVVVVLFTAAVVVVVVALVGVVHAFTITTTTTPIARYSHSHSHVRNSRILLQRSTPSTSDLSNDHHYHHYGYNNNNNNNNNNNQRKQPQQQSWSSLTSSNSDDRINSVDECAVNTNHDENNRTSNSNNNSKGVVIVVGATGYIGNAVVRECLHQHYTTICFVRKSRDGAITTTTTTTNTNTNTNGSDNNNNKAIDIVCDVTNATQVTEQMQFVKDTYCRSSSDDDDGTSSSTSSSHTSITAVISCLASRSGTKTDAYRIDYQATLHCLQSAIQTQTKQFIVLSAFCVQKPLLQFQQAKLKLEAAVQEQGDKGNILYTIVRPTAFFKSVSGQLEVVQSGAPFVLFDKGRGSSITACNPIAERDLATYMVDSIRIESNRYNQIMNLGGPDAPISMLQQGNMLFNATQMEPKFIYAPIWIFDIIINTLQFVSDLLQNEAIADMAETGRIGKYYAVEDMVTTVPNEKYGTITLQEHYNRIAKEGNDYDPYTTMFARARGINVSAIQNEMKNNGSNNSTSTSSSRTAEIVDDVVEVR